MRRIIILSLLTLALLPGADQAPRQADPRVPADALEILATLAGEQPLKLAESRMREAAIQTLVGVLRDQEAAKAKAAAPAAPPAVAVPAKKD